MGILSCAAIFSSNMVLQRNKNISVWGMAYDGWEVTVSINGVSACTVTEKHRWSVSLPAMEAGGPYEMTVESNGEKIVFTNVMIGEVWLAGGQSNMELELRNSLNGREVVENIKDVNVRFYYTKKISYIDEFFYADERNSSWTEAGSEETGIWSAVGYYFAKKLSEDLGVTVGVIGCNWGGTSASAWISKEMLASDTDTSAYLEDYNKAMDGKTFEQYCAELEEYEAWYAEWNPKIGEFYVKNPTATWDEALAYAGPSRWPEPLGPKSPYRPSGVYETMLKRVMPYTLAGFIYYQGESDDHRPKTYYKLLKMLVEQWRTDWNDDTLPFITVQLPMHMERGDENKTNWCYIREAQMRMHQTVKNTGIAVISECGEYGNIHPVDKQPVGERLELQALCHVYDKIPPDEAYGPVYRSCEYRNDSLVLSFLYAKDGFEIRGGKPTGFEIAGKDKKFVPADVKIDKDKITLSAEGLDRPAYARYNWINFAEVTVFSKNGIPLSPFRTSGNDDID